MRNPFGTRDVPFIVLISAILLVLVLALLENKANKQMQMQAFEKCLQNNLELAAKNTSSFPVTNYCKL